MSLHSHPLVRRTLARSTRNFIRIQIYEPLAEQCGTCDVSKSLCKVRSGHVHSVSPDIRRGQDQCFHGAFTGHALPVGGELGQFNFKLQYAVNDAVPPHISDRPEICTTD